ncbi:MAG: peptide-methionine (S)-S-oxide reductase MsrA [bacterium]|nr:peptide-methionine (S)-S-oxide reductase MsrA [bacterium]
MELATFGAGCFWGVESVFEHTAGVTKTAVGYSGGDADNPTYQQVCSGTTGHAEVVQLEFDPDKVTFAELLDVFFENHNPTALNRQGPDIGTQYRSAVFYHSDQQRELAEAAKAKWEASKKFSKPIVTEISPASEFYLAEEYHQKYLTKRGRGGSCHT